MHVIHGPHDKIFKRVMADRENAISLLENILPEPVRKMLVLEDMLQKTVQSTGKFVLADMDLEKT